MRFISTYYSFKTPFVKETDSYRKVSSDDTECYWVGVKRPNCGSHITIKWWANGSVKYVHWDRKHFYHYISWVLFILRPQRWVTNCRQTTRKADRSVTERQQRLCMKNGKYANPYSAHSCIVCGQFGHFVLSHHTAFSSSTRQSRWPCRLRGGSATARLLESRVRIPPRARTSVMSVLFCLVEVSVMGRSHIQGNPTARARVCVFVCVCACVSLILIKCNNNPLHLQWVGRRGQTKKERKKKNSTKESFQSSESDFPHGGICLSGHTRYSTGRWPLWQPERRLTNKTDKLLTEEGKEPSSVSWKMLTWDEGPCRCFCEPIELLHK